MIYFSPSRNMFYPEELLPQYKDPPKDLILLPSELMNEFYLTAPLMGLKGVDKSGKPVWVEVAIPVIPFEAERLA